MTHRYAIYHAPAPGKAWWKFGSHWLGRDERTGSALPQVAAGQLSWSELASITAQPRRYGFHATLKAPFRLAEGTTESELVSRVDQLAGSLAPVPLGTLVPIWMNGFVALVPARENPALNALAQTCVVELDDLRAPLTEAEIAHREPGKLDARGCQLLREFGYPLVLERFRFHMSLTGPIDAALAGRVIAQIANPVARLNIEAPPVLDRLCIFVEAQPGAGFLRIADAQLQT